MTFPEAFPRRCKSGMLPGWTHQKRLQNDPDAEMPSSQEVLNIIWGIDNIRDRALAMITYLTGGRISEVINLNPSNFYDRVVMKNNAQKIVLLVNMDNLKNRKDRIKRIPLDYDRYKPEITFIKKFIANFQPYERIFPIKRTSAYRLIKWGTTYNPHWLRHLRITHRCLEDGWSDQLLQRMAGWSDTRMATTYVKTRWVDIV